MKRLGAAKGTGSGYRNLRQFPKDSSIHAQSARGMKQPQRIPIPMMSRKGLSAMGEKTHKFHDGKGRLITIFYHRGGNGIIASYTINGESVRDRFGRVVRFDWLDDIDGLAHRIEQDAKFREGLKYTQRPKTEPLGDVWKLETPQQDMASDDLNKIMDLGIKGNRKAQNYLRTLWSGEKWDSIKQKAETEGSVWYVWYMDGVNQHLQNLKSKESSVFLKAIGDSKERQTEYEREHRYDR